MGLKAMLKTLDGLDDAQKALYRQDGDSFLLDVEPVDGWELTGAGLKNALQREREAREQAESKAKAFEGLDPEKVRDALSKVEKMKDWTPEDKLKEQIEAKTRELAAAKDTEIKAAIERAELYRKGYEGLTVDRQLEEALNENKFLAPKLAARLFRQNVRMVEKDGQLVTEVVGEDGKPLTRIDSSTGEYLKVGVKEFIAEQAKKPEFAELIRGNPATGTRGSDPAATQSDQSHRQNSPNYSEGKALEKLSKAMAPGT